MDPEDLLTDLQVLVVLLGLVAHLGLRALLDRLGQKVSQVLRGLQVLTVSPVRKGLQDSLAFLENRAYLFLHYRLFQEKKETMERASQDIQEVRVLLGLLAQQAILDQQDLVAVSTAWLAQLESELKGP